MLKWFRNRFDTARGRLFVKENPEWLSARTSEEIRGNLCRHPFWNQTSTALREELTIRLLSAKAHFHSFDAQDAFELMASMTEMFGVLHQNILPIDRDNSLVTEDKLWLISETFRKLGAKHINQAIKEWHRADARKIADALTTGIICLEVSVCIDHYKIDAMPLMAQAWVYRSSDFARAYRILKEFDDRVLSLPTARFHAQGRFDHSLIANLALVKQVAQMVREDIGKLKESGHTAVQT
ncbi:hypothetical protein BH09PLA1_BH09PLA1_06510 [soil metagenome]